MSAGLPKYRLAEKQRAEKSKAIDVSLSATQWEEVLEYLETVSNRPFIPYKETALYYMHNWNLVAGACNF